MRLNRLCYLLVILLVTSLLISCANQEEVKGSNPLLPGYFADPTVKYFDGTYYIYSTTDGIKLASGQPTVWISEDFLNWYNVELEIDLPEGLTNCWAPDVVKGTDGNYYYFMGNCQRGCNIYGYVADNPIGPWTPINDGKAVIPVGTSKQHLPALDAQFLKDNGSIYAYFGTWCTSFGGMGWVKINGEDMFTIEKEGFIPIEQIPHAFEAAYPMKMGEKYILMYSAGDCRLSSYSVHYAFSDSPEGPFTYGANNPILSSSEDGLIDGPGHHSIIQDETGSIILYHRHDNPHSTGGEFRQVCADRIEFLNDSTIERIIPGHEGVGALSRNTIRTPNLANGADVSASSYYHLLSEPTRYTGGPVDYKYLPEYVIDNNNGTMWKAGSHLLPQDITLDLGEMKRIKRIMTSFEYPTFYYQYKVEVSKDNSDWILYADRTGNHRSGSPMIDDNDMKARYIRLTVTGTEKAGMYAAIWNIKVYGKTFKVPELINKEVKTDPVPTTEGTLILELDPGNLEYGRIIEPVMNNATLGGEFIPIGSPSIEDLNNIKCLKLDGESFLRLSKKAPETLAWNSPFTASAWVLNPEVGHGECIISWNTRRNMLQSSYAALMYGSGNYGAMAHGDGAVDVAFRNVPAPGKWHHICVSFDGMKETIYVNGKLERQLPLNLFVENDEILIGTTGAPHEHLSAYLYNVRLYDKAFDPSEIKDLMAITSPLNQIN